jgi:hypothetical protein
VKNLFYQVNRILIHIKKLNKKKLKKTKTKISKNLFWNKKTKNSRKDSKFWTHKVNISNCLKLKIYFDYLILLKTFLFLKK